MTQSRFIFAAAAGSFALLAGAFAFQHLGGLAPCKMCIWQRYPHAIALALAAVAFFVPGGTLALAGAAAMLVTAGVGGFHVGVEQGWWEGPSTCSSGDISGLSTDALMDQIMSAPLVRCDEIAWSLAGISMAGWNAILSLLLCGFWIAAWRKA
ncbi:MAG: disulfide bond formation protein B [Rhodobacteraceae bacterium]|nr:disulfide bond formation protein B [Paracoccaceae bacterium]